MNLTSQQTKCRSTAFGPRRYLFWALLAITVLTIVVPAAVMFSKRKKTTPPKSSILVPLYVYPAPGAWEPLFTAYATSPHFLSDDSQLTHLDRIASHPGLNFTIVINPASGPGNGAGPDANYTREIPRLNAYANVRTFGYVSTDYAKRNLGLVLRDISTYSAWSENATFPGLGMHGIFLDETSSQYEPASAQFFETIASAVRSEAGLGLNPLVSAPCSLRICCQNRSSNIFEAKSLPLKAALLNLITAQVGPDPTRLTTSHIQIIHNPGTIPDAKMLSPAICDLSVVFEGTYSTYQIYGFGKQISTLLASSKCGREKLACIVHAVPSALNSNDVLALVNGLRTMVGSVFLTALSVDYYASFSPRWAEFADEMAV